MIFTSVAQSTRSLTLVISDPVHRTTSLTYFYYGCPKPLTLVIHDPVPRTRDPYLLFTTWSSEPLRISCSSLPRPYKYFHLPVLHFPVPRATATLSQLPPFDIVSRTKLVTRAWNVIRLHLLLMAEQLAPTPCASLRRHLDLRLSWYQWTQTWTCCITWSLCTWGVQVRPQTPVWSKKKKQCSKAKKPSSFVVLLTILRSCRQTSGVY